MTRKDDPEMRAALDADAAFLARTGRYGTAYPRLCTKRLAQAQAEQAARRAADQEAAEVARRARRAAVMRACRARKRGVR